MIKSNAAFNVKIIEFYYNYGVSMQGIAIQSTKDKYKISIDKKIYDEKTISSLLNFLELEYLASKVDFNKDIMNLAKEIRSDLWKKEKTRLGF